MQDKKTKLQNNPNDPTASIYDIFTRPLKGYEVTELELELIQKLVIPGSKILDIGCGTGRHAIPLALAGYEVTGIDSSREMLKIAKQKAKSCQLSATSFIEADILTYNLQPSTFHLITFFWNAFNEICLTKQDAKKLLSKLKQTQTPNGKILLNMDHEHWMEDLQSFETKYEKDGLTYTQNWTIKKFNKKTNTTTSEEIIIVEGQNGKVISETKSLITQRWWRREELENLCKDLGLKLELIQVKNIEENYYLLNLAE